MSILTTVLMILLPLLIPLLYFTYSRLSRAFSSMQPLPPLPPGSVGWPYFGETFQLYSNNPLAFFTLKQKRFGVICAPISSNA